MYIELKSGFEDNGPAWIGKVEQSKSGRTIYFNGQAFKANRNPTGWGNYHDLETGDNYWISGVKKDGTDRHWAGGGTIQIDRSIVDEYLALVDLSQLDKSRYELVDIQPTDKQKFVQIEN